MNRREIMPRALCFGADNADAQDNLQPAIIAGIVKEIAGLVILDNESIVGFNRRARHKTVIAVNARGNIDAEDGRRRRSPAIISKYKPSTAREKPVPNNASTI